MEYILAHFVKNRLSIFDVKNELLKVKIHRLRWAMEYILRIVGPFGNTVPSINCVYRGYL